MKASKAFLAGSLGVLLASSMALGSPMYYTLDDGNSEDFPNEANGNIWCGGNTNESASINMFKTDIANNLITQLSVAWANLPADTSARVVLYSIAAGYPAAGGSYSIPTWLTPLQVISTTVTAGQANPLTADPLVVYTIGPVPPAGKLGLQTKGVVDNPVWTTYDITPTLITSEYFGVGVINPCTSSTYGPALLDLDTTVPYGKVSWLAVGAANASLNANLGNIYANAAFVYLDDGVGPPDSQWGVGNNPYLIRAGVLPEPTSFMLLGLAAFVGRFLLLRRS